MVDGLVIVDKPSGWTSHDVVARMRQIAGTRRVGHAGTLDPMATGVLVCGIGKATKILGRVSGSTKAYEATIRLGIATTTDDAEGEVVSVADALAVAADRESLDEQITALTGPIMQRPSAVSAIKVDGKRAYERVRAGEGVTLAARPVIIERFDVDAVRVSEDVDGKAVVDLDVRIECSTGTYVRALARDLGDALGVGGHLTALRRTRVAGFGIDHASTLVELEHELTVTPLAQACAGLFASVVVNHADAVRISHGGRIDWPNGLASDDTVAVYGPEQRILALAECKDNKLAPTVVWAN
ncbi:MAG: tRNA pseudouridine(55) synthase TruB [Candidatus Nanopelagicales bacterium]